MKGRSCSPLGSCLCLPTNKTNKPKKKGDSNYHDQFDAKYTQIALVVYVDGLTAGVDLDCPETKQFYDKFVSNMRSSFIIEDRGICDSMLGCKIDYHSGA